MAWFFESLTLQVRITSYFSRTSPQWPTTLRTEESDRSIKVPIMDRFGSIKWNIRFFTSVQHLQKKCLFWQ